MARIAGLDAGAPTLEAVERRRVQLWALSTLLLVLLAAAVLISTWTPELLPHVVAPVVLRVSVLALVVGFCVYATEKEMHLRRLSRLLFEERVLITALSNRLREVSLLLEAGKAMNAVLELDQVLEVILRSVLELLRGATGSIMLFDPERAELEVVSAHGSTAKKGMRVPLGQGVAGAVAARREPLLLAGEVSGEQFPGLVVRATQPDSAMSVPLIHRGDLVGVLNVSAGRGTQFSEYDLRALSLFAEQAATTVANARLFQLERRQAELLSHLAYHDPLTGLANRSLLLDRTGLALARARREGDLVAALFVDLDGFKAVNDEHGHATGDLLLVEVARRLRTVLRSTDTLARLGGDEFVLLCDGLGGEIEAVGLADRVLAAIRPAVAAGAVQLSVTASVGIALAAAGDDPDTLLRDADTAMYRAKRAGRNRSTVFNRPLRARDGEGLRLESVVRHAIDRGHLHLVYAPVAHAASGRWAGAEALLRLDDPERGVLEPADFMVAAEEAGVAGALGRWALEEACRHLVALGATGLDGASDAGEQRAGGERCWVSVDVSRTLLTDPQFPDDVARILTRSGADARRLRLELPEAALVDASDAEREVVTRLVGLGVHVGVDSFGARYSSMSQLRHLPLSFVKVDTSLAAAVTRSPGDLAVVESVVHLSNALGISVVALGVDTAEQAAAVRAAGCTLVQGAYAGLPASALHLAAHLR